MRSWSISIDHNITGARQNTMLDILPLHPSLSANNTCSKDTLFSQKYQTLVSFTFHTILLKNDVTN